MKTVVLLIICALVFLSGNLFSQNLLEHQKNLSKINNSNPALQTAKLRHRLAKSLREYASLKAMDAIESARKQAQAKGTNNIRVATAKTAAARTLADSADNIAKSAEEDALIADNIAAGSVNSPTLTFNGNGSGSSLQLPGGISIPSITPQFNYTKRNNSDYFGVNIFITGYTGEKISDKSSLNNSLLFLIPEASTYGANVGGLVSAFSDTSRIWNIAIVANGYYNARQISGTPKVNPNKTDSNFTTDNLMVKIGIEGELFGSVSAFYDYNIIWLNGPNPDFANFYNTNQKRFEYTDCGIRGIFNISNTSTATNTTYSLSSTDVSASTSSINLELGFLISNSSLSTNSETKKFIGTGAKSYYPWLRIGFVHSILSTSR